MDIDAGKTATINIVFTHKPIGAYQVACVSGDADRSFGLWVS